MKLEVLIVDEIIQDLRRRGAWGTEATATSINRQNEIRGAWLVKIAELLKNNDDGTQAVKDLTEQLTELRSALQTRDEELAQLKAMPAGAVTTYKVEMSLGKLDAAAERIAEAAERIADVLQLGDSDHIGFGVRKNTSPG